MSGPLAEPVGVPEWSAGTTTEPRFRKERRQVSTTVPDFLYIGTRKSASTWLYNILALHPQVYLPASKGLYFFDQNYANGSAWYLAHFDAVTDERVAGELSHSYLSSPPAAERIAGVNPQMKLLACLREPVDRAFSEYLDIIKNGRFDGSFEAALDRFPILLERGRYATHLHRYVDTFGRDQLLVQLLDDLKEDSQAYADKLFTFLGVDCISLPSSAMRRRMPASEPRSRALAAAAKTASRLVSRVGLQRVRSRVKRSDRIRQALYRPYTEEDRPRLDPQVAAQLKAEYAPEMRTLDSLFDVPISARWGYPDCQP